MPNLNKQLALDAMAIITDGRLERADELVHSDYHNHEAAAELPGGPEGFKRTVTILRGAFSDIRFEPHDVIAEDDRVVVRGQFTARHVGPFAGMAGTGRRLSIQQVHVWRVASGKLIEHWSVRDRMEVLRQLGLLRVGRGEQGGA
jgi:predicted ester cyclase